jgi:hypothetical protein
MQSLSSGVTGYTLNIGPCGEVFVSGPELGTFDMALLVERPSRVERLRSAYGGWLDLHISKSNSVRILHLSGTPRQMGRQCGALTGGMIARVLEKSTAIFTAAGLPEAMVHRVVDRVWEQLRAHTPKRYLDEIAGIAEGAQEHGVKLSEMDLHRLVTMTNLDMYKRDERFLEMLGPDAAEFLEHLDEVPALSCTMFAVWGERTEDGKLYALRNLDWVSQAGIHEERLITVYRPEGRNAFASIGYAGGVGCLAGMNEKGITVSEVGAFSTHEEFDGIPWVLMARQILEEADNLEDGEEIVRHAAHTLGYNYLIADGDPARYPWGGVLPRRALAFETNHDAFAMFTDDDPKEHAAVWRDLEGGELHYGTPMREAILRADTAFGEETRAAQAADNGPGEPENTGDPRGGAEGTSYTDCHLPMAHMIRAYERGEAYTFPVRGTQVIEAGEPRKIGPAEALNIAATVAHNTEKLALNDWNVMSVVYAPTDLEFYAAWESHDEQDGWKNAPDGGYLHFDLLDLLD